MKTRSLNPLPLLAFLGLTFTAACGGEPGDCFGAAEQQTCVYEVCDAGAGCHFEVHTQAMTKAELAARLYKAPGTIQKDPPPPPPKKKK